ncbi:hypothetical protein SAMN00790413_01699 [Deinococcus hopiensis KR-140]|uniref:Uncharacterized protein n=1 Tax=Deinococcus hopiensis KR-140 TaxID=695939 RepID=A0A1W1VHB4_9DEIO|nr:hypothetical protein SAMN00790413_01699 [Deinococcus hopiensis KR-140]
MKMRRAKGIDRAEVVATRPLTPVLSHTWRGSKNVSLSIPQVRP